MNDTLIDMTNMNKEKTMKEVTITRPLPFQIGNQNGVNLVGPISELNDLAGTILDGTADVIVYRDKRFPAPLKFGGVKVKEIFVPAKNENGMVSLGEYYDLDPLYSSINSAIARDEEVSTFVIEKRIAQILDKKVIRQHAGKRLSGVAMGLPALGYDEIGLPVPMADELRRITGLESISGLLVRVERFPLAEGACSSLFRVRCVSSYHESIFINPGKMKRMGGDFDSDQLHINPTTTFIPGDDRSIKPISITKVTCTWDKNVRRHNWIPSVQLSEGLWVAKGLQGVVTNAIENLAAVAVTLWNENPEFADAVLEMLGNVAGISGLTTIIKDGCAVYFEITQDYRKYAEGEDGRYEDPLWNFIDVALGKRSRLDTKLAASVSKDGRVVNHELINLILSYVTKSGAQGVRQYLEARPVIKSTIGQVDSIPADAVAEYIAEHGVESMIQVMAGLKTEPTGKLIVSKKSRGRRFEEEAVRALPAYRSGRHGWQYVIDILDVIDDNCRYGLYEDNRGMTLIVNNVRVPLGRIELKAGRSHVAVKYNGDKKLSSLVVTYTTEDRTPRSLVLTTIHYLLAKAIKDAMLDCEGAADSRIKSRIITAVEEILDTHSQRVPKGEIPLQHLEAQIATKDTGVVEGYLAHKQLALLLSQITLTNPITGEPVEFEVGLISKSKPGKTVAYKTPGFNHPSMMNEACPWIDNVERTRRECRTLKSAKVPVNACHWYTRDVKGHIADRSMDGIWLLIDGTNVMFDTVENNGDMALITAHGLKHFAVHEDQAKYANLQVCDANRIAREIMKDDSVTYHDLETIGWEVTVSFRRIGRVKGNPANEQHITLIAPATPVERTWVKPWVCGHKFVAQRIEGVYSVQVGGALVPVCGFIPIESMLGKKLDASICLAYDGLYRGRREFDINTPAIDQVNELPESHNVYLDGVCIGDAIPGIYPTFILAEDEEIKTAADHNSFPKSAQRARMIGESIKISKSTAIELQLLAEASVTLHKENEERILEEMNN